MKSPLHLGVRGLVLDRATLRIALYVTSTSSAAAQPSLKGRAIELLRRDVFPSWWAFVPVAGKATYVKEWVSKPLTRETLIETYRANSGYHGLGVVTGEFSGGLIALDIDGPKADERYRAAAGEGYEPVETPGTMSWTSGKPGRRQLLYRVPASVVPELRHVKTLILRDDGAWHLGTGDDERQRKRGGDETETPAGKYEEVVLRFNACQSVVPGSPHPDTGKAYRFINYNGGEVATAPDWVMDVLRGFRRPVQWLSDADQKALDAELGETTIPSRQIRGWFFKEEVQSRLLPRLDELIFRHPVFDQYGWKERGGSKPQRMSGCPWHGGQSGTSFQYSTESGCWDCKACGTGGDCLDFLHRVERNDPYAERPQGPDLERYVAEVATALGFNYPEDVKVQVTKEVTGLRMDRRALLDAAKKILREVRNPAEQHLALMDLSDRSGLYGMQAKHLKALAVRDMSYGTTVTNGIHQGHGWSKNVTAEDYIIPGLLRKPSQVMLHARGGVGKSEMALALAKAVGRGETVKVRGLDVQCEQGRVLWFSNDQGNSRLAAMLARQGIEEDGRDKAWFELMSNWKVDLFEEFREQVMTFKPSLIVMDSLGTMLQDISKENEGDYADWIYRLATLNGDMNQESGFPGTAIIWIHHNTKSDEDFRGSDRLMNAMDETWALRRLNEEEEAEYGTNRRILTINKSRFDRGGDRLIIHRDLEFNYSISDMTPLVQKEGVNHNGNSTPETLTLAILADAKAPMGRAEILKELHARMRGEGRREKELPSEWGLRKYLAIWLTDGLVEATQLPSSGKGRPQMGYVARGAVARPAGASWSDDPGTWPAPAAEFFVAPVPGGGAASGDGPGEDGGALGGEPASSSQEGGSLARVGRSPEPHKKSERGSDPLREQGSDFLCDLTENAPEGGCSQKMPAAEETPADGTILDVNGSTRISDGLNVSGLPEGPAHKKSASESPSAAMDPEDADFLCEPSGSIRRKPDPTTEDVTHGRSPQAPEMGAEVPRGEEHLRPAAGGAPGAVPPPRGGTQAEWDSAWG